MGDSKEMKKLVYVRWRDASLDTVGSATYDEFEPDYVVDTAGIFMGYKNHHILVALQYFDRTDRFRDVLSIPIDMVIKKKFFNLEKK